MLPVIDKHCDWRENKNQVRQSQQLVNLLRFVNIQICARFLFAFSGFSSMFLLLVHLCPRRKSWWIIFTKMCLQCVKLRLQIDEIKEGSNVPLLNLSWTRTFSQMWYILFPSIVWQDVSMVVFLYCFFHGKIKTVSRQ